MAGSTNTEETPLVLPDDMDEIEDMTWGRRLARHLAARYEWYNPHLNNPNGPSLDHAWSIFEHVTLARHFTHAEEGAVDVNRKAEAGESESPTKLYSVLNTPESDLGDFGVGVGE
jgi:hypothetical protein